jgi:aspartate 1-decarboxylase|tara:strand:- start:709 stop:1059 length:351 start_codon:yes stop_codon:yes gene_type:complete
MQIKLLKSKIHRAKITDANLEYEGSISIDSELMGEANLKIYEKVHVLSLTTGARIETYVIPDPPGSKNICVNGAAAHLIHPGHRVIILSYCLLDVEDFSTHKPSIIKVNEQNNIVV